MESFIPIFLCLVVPFIWTAIVFIAGRWSARHVISINRVESPAQAAASPYFQNFRQEE